MIYWAVLLFIFMGALSQNKFYSAMILFTLFCMAAFIAPDVSHDFQNYYNGYYLSTAGFFPEPLSRIIFRGANELSLPILVSFIILSFFSVLLKAKAVKKLSLPLSLFFLIYFGKLYLLLDLTQIRAAIAISLCLLAFECYINGKSFKALLFVITAFCLHLSSIMFLILFFINKKRPNFKFWSCSVVLGIALSFVDIKSYLLALMLILQAPENYLTYINGGPEITVNPLNSLAIVNVIIFIIFCNLRSIFIDAKMNVAFKLYSISIISFYIFLDFPVLSFRISEFFLIYQAVLLSNVICFIKKEQRRIYVVFMFLFSAMQLYLTYNKSAIIEPYKLIFF